MRYERLIQLSSLNVIFYGVEANDILYLSVWNLHEQEHSLSRFLLEYKKFTPLCKLINMLLYSVAN